MQWFPLYVKQVTINESFGFIEGPFKQHLYCCSSSQSQSEAFSSKQQNPPHCSVTKKPLEEVNWQNHCQNTDGGTQAV